VCRARQPVSPSAEDFWGQLDELIRPELGKHVGVELDLRIVPRLGSDLEVLQIVGYCLAHRVSALRTRLKRL
jgi:hypothetical protein